MVLQIFRPPGNNELLQDCKLGDINDAISLEYENFFCGVGTFTLELSPASPFAGVIGVNSLIYYREDDICWVVKNIKTTAEKVTVTGYDLNGLLLDRLTLPTEDGEAGTEGKDAVSGSTEACVKHFVEYNLISSEMPERNIPRLVASENMDRGIAQDSYLASKECLEDVVRTMCGGAGLGYRIRLDLTQSTSEPLLIFDVLEQCDRSADQDERNRVIFSEGMRNVGGIERELGVTAEKNALWCEVGGLDGFVNSGENIPAGWARREEYVSLSVTDPYNQEFVDEAAQKEMSDKFASTDSLTVEAGNPLEYGVVYDVGDIVTVYDREKSAQLNSVISAVTVKRTATEHTVKLTLGESKPKLLDGYAKKTDLLAKNQRDYPAGSSGGTTVYYANNPRAVTVGEASEVLLQIQFAATATAAPIFGATLQLDLTSGGTVEFILNYDNVHLITYSQLYMAGAANKSITIPLPGTGSGSHVLQLCLKSADAVGTAAAGASYGWVMGSDLAENNAWDGTITARQQGAVFRVLPLNVTPAPAEAIPAAKAPRPIGIMPEQGGAVFRVEPAVITAVNVNEEFPTAPIGGANDGDSAIVIVFPNPVDLRDGAAALSGFTVTAEIGRDVEKLSVSGVEQVNRSELRLNVPALPTVTGACAVTYVSRGGLTDKIGGRAVADFIVKFTPDFGQTYSEGENNA